MSLRVGITSPTQTPRSTNVFQPPYPILTAQVGGIPELIPDLPITAVFLAFFLLVTLWSSIIIFKQIRNHQRWTIAAIILLFAAERTPALVMRIAWTFRPTNIAIAVTSHILLQAGVVVLYLGNLVYVGAVIRAGTGRHTWLTILEAALSIMTLSAFVMGVVSVVVEVHTLDERTRENCLWLQRAVATYFVALTTTPLALLVAAFRGHRKSLFRVMKDTFSDAAITTVAALLCMLTSSFRAAVSWAPQRALFNPAWYHSRAAFYAFELAPEVLLLLVYMLARVDQRFHRLGESQTRVEAVAPPPPMTIPSFVVTESPSASKATSTYTGRHVSETPPRIPEIYYTSPV